MVLTAAITKIKKPQRKPKQWLKYVKDEDGKALIVEKVGFTSAVGGGAGFVEGHYKVPFRLCFVIYSCHSLLLLGIFWYVPYN
ncbi:hypothetical protein MEZE111188_21445 [Mesobacillus zeae]